MGGIGSTIQTAADVASDPYLSEVVCRVQQLRAVDRGQAVPACTPTASTSVPGTGVGLRSVMPALRAYVYAQRNPWVYPLAAAAVVGLPLWLGYRLGRQG